MCVCVCFGDPCAQKIFWIERLFWEIFVLIGSLVELYVGLYSYLCFSHLEKLFWKAVSTPPQYLAICQASKAFFLTQSRHLLDTWWINRESSTSSIAHRHLLDRLSFYFWIWLFVARYLLDTSAVEDQILDTYLDTSQYLSCWALLKVLYISQSRFFSHFFDISRSVCDCSSPKHSPFHSKPLPQGFFKLFQVSPYLVSS